MSEEELKKIRDMLWNKRDGDENEIMLEKRMRREREKAAYVFNF